MEFIQQHVKDSENVIATIPSKRLSDWGYDNVLCRFMIMFQVCSLSLTTA